MKINTLIDLIILPSVYGACATRFTYNELTKPQVKDNG